MGANPKRFVVNAEQRVFVEKKWGYEDWIWNGRYCGKKLALDKGKECSFHYHKVKDEVIYVATGKVLMLYGWDEDISTAAALTMTPDMAFHIPPGMYHKFKGLEESVMFEFSTHHSDKDVVRAGDTDTDKDVDDDAEEDSDTDS